MTVLLHEMLLNGGPPPGPPFISTWRTAAAGETITLPLVTTAGASYNFVVDWGDGTFDAITSATDAARIHAFATAGDHQIKITGAITGWAFANGGDKLKFISIDQWGCLRFIPNHAAHFQGCANMQIPAIDVPVLGTSCQTMFSGCTTLLATPTMATWDTSGVTSMAGMFNGCAAFNADLSSWQTGSVTDMSTMFSGCAVFNQPIGSWNVSKVTTMASMFQNAKAFNADISSWQTTSLLYMQQMFMNASAFNNVSIGSWDVSKVVTMASTFQGSTYNQPLTGWNTVNVTSMNAMFMSHGTFNQPVGHFKTAKVTNFLNMFYGAAAFNQDISSWDTSAATTFSGMFQNARVFNSALTNWRTPALVNMTNMFNGCNQFNQDISLFDVSRVTAMPGVFASCGLFNQDISGWNTGAVTNMTGIFNASHAFNCGEASGVVHTKMQRTATGGWRIGGITSANLNQMFYNAWAFAGDISSWCADAATTLPTNFATGANANFTVARHPTWGACPIPD